MRLPNVEAAIIAPTKLTQYLLTNEPSKGRGKPGFFLRFGFTRDQWEDLAHALRDHALRYGAVSESDLYGMKYRVVGELVTPDGATHASVRYG